MAIEDDVATLQAQMATLLGTTIPALESADTALDGRLDVVEPALTTAQSDITALDGRMDTAETDIGALESADTGLDTRLDTAETDIDALETAASEASDSNANLRRVVQGRRERLRPGRRF